MGCSAGKPLSTSPEISTSTQHSTLASVTGKNEHVLSNNGLVDIKRSSNNSTITNSSSIRNGGIRKDSSSSVKSFKVIEPTEAPKIANQTTQSKTRLAQDQVKAKREKENGGAPKKDANIKINRSNSTDDPPVKSVPLGQVKVQLTQSQADFFTMLDKKIEEGEDYKSDCER
ncbi:uncharacterized protein LOC116296919 [Actinia tenebrosa]|uniref:Uncharacterized protein LOC116296919 n=1 Tax=Actinia tenebrosa TaxID=6105 RepID=A0A6P8HWX1_ACTTE|nr:uncharacterized protein LOC116296919 [Actinia tenebrosa]XP_031560893.1 uncharacterized protein LOC116296919 [Actinia tenebrosa]XP_031560894.1 uncharacterized protein LOC116296919 [Actinia tenebrosa]XP_031560895.1 uncharacterized protein LOC116296919 [Actinia tenebrosa]